MVLEEVHKLLFITLHIHKFSIIVDTFYNVEYNTHIYKPRSKININICEVETLFDTMFLISFSVSIHGHIETILPYWEYIMCILSYKMKKNHKIVPDIEQTICLAKG